MIMLLSTSSVYAISNVTNEVVKVSEIPIENAVMKVSANSIAGPRIVLETDSCLKVVEFLKIRIGDKPLLIMDGGYRVFINDNITLSSSSDDLYAWMIRCSEKYSK